MVINFMVFLLRAPSLTPSFAAIAGVDMFVMASPTFTSLDRVRITVYAHLAPVRLGFACLTAFACSEASASVRFLPATGVVANFSSPLPFAVTSVYFEDYSYGCVLCCDSTSF